MRVHLDDSAKMRHRYRTNLNRYRRLMGVTDKFDVTIEKREFDHNLISHAARCLAAALASSLCECKMLCTVRTYSAQTGDKQARKQTQPVPAGTGTEVASERVEAATHLCGVVIECHVCRVTPVRRV